jgi:hypothetical protein
MKFFNVFNKKFKNLINKTDTIEEVVQKKTDDVSDLIEKTHQKSIRNSQNQLEFIDSSKLVFSSIPIRLAKDVPVNIISAAQKKGTKSDFPICPGMFDYSRLGYILCAWEDIHFKVNKAGVVTITGTSKRPSRFKDKPVSMDPSPIEGIFTPQDGIPLSPVNLNSPWKVFSYDDTISALSLPAIYHSSPEFLENFFVFPGIVDYKSFHVLNVILAPKRKMEYTIHAGDPLLHIIPFYNRDIVCGYGPPNIEQESLINYDPTINRKNFYRKNHATKKNFKLSSKE